MVRTEAYEWALRYAAHGWHVFPCFLAHNEAKGRPEKKAAIKNWQNVASTDPERIAGWFGGDPRLMVGLAHRLTGTVALDIDRHDADKDGFASLAELASGGEEITSCARFTSASGGEQRLFVRPPDRTFDALSGNFPGSLGPGLDLIFGFSVLPSGVSTPGREWQGNPFSELPPYAPAWVARPIREREARDAKRLDEILAQPSGRTYVRDVVRDEAYVLRKIAEQSAIVGAYGDQTSGYNVVLSRAAILVGRAIGKTGMQHLLQDAEQAFVRSSARAASRHDHASMMTGFQSGIETGRCIR